MFAKRLLQKATHLSQKNVHSNVMLPDVGVQIAIHYGIPSTASVLAFDPIQSLLAIGTLDGRIKVIGGDNIEALLISPKHLPYKYLEFLQNKGLLVSISNDNDIQVSIFYGLFGIWRAGVLLVTQWEYNITAFSVIYASHFMQYGTMSVLKYETGGAELLQLPYHISADYLTEAAGFSVPNHHPIVGVLPQPCSSGKSVLIAYASGLFILWDVVEARILVVRGDKVLELKDGVVDSPSEVRTYLPGDASERHLEEKEISALCWASSTGSILAVGYIDGDILFWKTTSAATSKGKQAGLSCNNVVKIQLSSAERKLPVIVLHWSANSKSHNDCDGQLFIYGGCEIGSEEVLTVLSLEWSSGMETLRCVGRVDLTLNGSFADMILLPTAGTTGNNHNTALFVLTNPGQLHFFDDSRLSASLSQQEKRISLSAVEFPVVVPAADMTVAKLSILPPGGNSSDVLSKKSGSTPTLTGGMRWPLTGGISNRSLFTENNRVERVYVAGRQDGSVSIWDATYPVLSLICVLESEVKGMKVAGSSASVSAVDFCSLNLSLAVGNECGLVHIYNLNGSLDEKSFHFVMETKHEVHNLSQGKGPRCRAVFSLLNFPVQALQFTSCGAKLAVGYDCGRVAVLDMRSLSVLCLTDCVSAPSSPVISVTWKTVANTNGHVRSPKNSGSNIADNSVEELIFVLTKDAKVYVINGGSGIMISSRPMHLKKDSTAISMYVIEGNAEVSGLSNKKQPQKDADARNETSQDTTSSGIDKHENDSLALFCCKDTLRLYHTKSVVQGENKSISKVKLAKPCCWITIFKKDEKVCGLVLFYETGDVEIRSFPDLDLVKESSLMSILRWNFTANMGKTMSSTDNGLITLANGCELAFISLLACKNSFRIPESLPSLHDNVLAAAAEAAICFSFNQKKKQGTAPRILGSIVKGFKGGKVNHTNDGTVASTSNYSHLEGVFSRNPFPDPSSIMVDNPEATELNIDDIEIDEPVSLAFTSTNKPQRNQRGMDASSAAGQARNKLLERQEKLERISRRTEELQSGAEDFASLANELVKAMESRKWWQI
ncbi:Syntaxin-binding protein 5-like [Camellia lanceoleosa]|uniref:Syntaxin-binding protein 5-like n=1 Tax=Camellia lanceoleosa TaxID=1840588 RepID=A0ACC0HKZ7_9ERIC|nr:Syntaxin-binding protein 5-like [Camellia lanceoleosa]